MSKLSLEKCKEYLTELNLTDEEIIKLRSFYEYVANKVINHVAEQKQDKRL